MRTSDGVRNSKRALPATMVGPLAVPLQASRTLAMSPRSGVRASDCLSEAARTQCTCRVSRSAPPASRSMRISSRWPRKLRLCRVSDFQPGGSTGA